MRSWAIAVRGRGCVTVAACFVLRLALRKRERCTALLRTERRARPAAGIEVILIQLQGGMQPVANTKTDAQGQFSFDNPTLGTAPMLVRAVFHGVNFHQPVTPGKTQCRDRSFRSDAGCEDDFGADAHRDFSAEWAAAHCGRRIFGD